MRPASGGAYRDLATAISGWVLVRTISEVVGADEAHARSAAHAVFGLINSTPHSARLSRSDMADQLSRMAMAALYACG